MQAIRRLLTVVLWLFIFYFAATGWNGFKISAASFCAARGCSSQALNIFTWLHIGILAAAGLLVQMLILWIFAERKVEARTTVEANSPATPQRHHRRRTAEED